MNKIYFKFIICLSLLACDSGRKIHSELKNGKIKLEYEYIVLNGDTIWDGNYKSFFDNGNIKEELNYRNNNAHGLAKTYWENGNIKSIVDYDEGLINSQIGNWGFDGKNVDSLSVVDGKGVLKDYYKNGRIKQLIEIDGKKANGKSIEYDLDNQIISSKTMINNIEHGDAMKVELGKTMKFTYKFGKLNGDYYVFDSHKNLIIKGKFRNDILIDTTYEYYSNKKVKRKLIYKSDNYTELDSLKLGILKSNGIFNLFQQNLNQQGIVINIKEYDLNGKEKRIE